MKTVQLLTIATLSLCATSPLFAADTVEADKTLAEKVLEKYQSLQTYHAKWEVGSHDPNMPEKMIWEVAFERENKNVLFGLTIVKTDIQSNIKLGMLLLADRKNMKFARADGNEIRKSSKQFSDPNQLNYRDVRRAIPFIYPFDLPLIFSEDPFMEVVQGEVKEIKTLTKEFEFYPGFAVYSKEFCFEYKIDPNSLLIKSCRVVAPEHPELPAPVYINKFVQTDKKLPSDLFDFEKQLDQFSSSPTKKKEIDSNL